MNTTIAAVVASLLTSHEIAQVEIGNTDEHVILTADAGGSQ